MVATPVLLFLWAKNLAPWSSRQGASYDVKISTSKVGGWHLFSELVRIA